jgi:hypothetical protein
MEDEVMNPLWEATTDEGYTAKATYDPATRLYTVVVDTPKGSLNETFPAMYEPRFGIDVSDAATAENIAELLLNKLEAA